jgi:Stress responsive A/B Barrel Domain
MSHLNRRTFLQFAPLACATVMRPSWAGAESTHGIMHIIRIRFAPGISDELRAQMMRSVNRFKQIRAASTFIAGRDLAPPSQEQYDVTQIAMLHDVDAYRRYFYDPIHLAADREAYSTPGKPFAGFSSFDTITGERSSAEQLQRIAVERDAKFKANDTRPTKPPVADRPRDQRWNQSEHIYHVVRLNLKSLNDAQLRERLDAIARMRAIAGVSQLFIGEAANPTDTEPFTHTLLINLESADAYVHYLADPLHRAQLAAGGTLPPHSAEQFDVIDPMNSALAERLRAMRA